MDEERAAAVAEALDGDLWQSGGGIWLVLIRRHDGAVVVLSDECVAIYDNERAFERGEEPRSRLLLRA